jgi:hypothetical protein
MASTTYTYTSPVIGTSGQVLMSNGASNTITWGTTTTTNTSPWTVSNSSGSSPYVISADPNLKGASLLVSGDAEFEGDVKIKGKSLTKLIDNIEKRLAILHPNERLEEKWEKLKILGEQYREMEKELLHAEEMWKILKK